MPFNDLKGEDRAKRMLLGAFNRQRIAGAYLFCGQDIEKIMLFTKEFAKLLNCGQSCGGCLTCRKIENSVHPDYIVIRPEGKKGIIKIDRIRELKDRISIGPSEGKRLVAVIEGADNIEAAAANSALKILEEPPEKVVIILVVSRIENLPKTVVSRCQRIIFSGLPQESPEHVDIPESSEIPDLLDYSVSISSGFGEGERKNVENKLAALLIKFREMKKIKEAKAVLNAVRDIKRMANMRITLDNMSLAFRGASHE
ncbi:MAG: hypothetical protein NTZ10_07375 [Candidatus Saganbacteria bacterium]|nr:hypothetical protein [Candidatus Saganbacteria bacterium]